MTLFPIHQRLKKQLAYRQSPYRKEIIRKDINFIVGRQLKKLRLAQALNGTQLGKILGISQQQVSRYENGMTSLPLENMVTLCVYFDISLEWFLMPLMSITRDDNANEQTVIG